MTSGDKCDRCGEYGQDRRTLFMACLYEMDELGLPFKHLEVVSPETATDLRLGIDKRFYTLLVCKDCRADWMWAIQEWFHSGPTPPQQEANTGYFVRELGTTKEMPLPQAKSEYHTAVCQLGATKEIPFTSITPVTAKENGNEE